MKKITNIIVGILAMVMVSAIFLMGLSVLVFVFKWQASKAIIGIMVTYILAGIGGGLTMKWYLKKEMRRQSCCGIRDETVVTIKEKVTEVFCASTFFIIILWLLSIVLKINGSIELGRFFLVWMLVSGSTALARIL